MYSVPSQNLFLIYSFPLEYVVSPLNQLENADNVSSRCLEGMLVHLFIQKLGTF